MPKLKHYNDFGTARFITFCCYRLQPYLRDIHAQDLIVQHINEARIKYSFKILGYVIMPEHVHLVIIPSDGIKLGLVVGEIKSKMAREYFGLQGQRGKNIFWQKRCYDHNCRSRETTREKIVYCHNNPVKRGLADSPAHYKMSSYNWYDGKKDVPLIMDDCE